jgi:HlyD family secretion protein
MTESQKPSTRKGLRRLLLIALALLVIVLAKILLFKGKFLYAGTLEATKVDLSARVAAGIDEERVREGDRVTKAELLIRLDCTDIRIAARFANEFYERALRLYKAGSGSKDALDQMGNRKQDADARLSWCDIASPIDGKVLNRYHEPGEYVNPGTKLLTLANIKDIWAYIYIPETLLPKVKPGMELTGYLSEMGNRAFQGRVLKVNDEAEFTPKNVQTQAERERLVFGVKVSFLGANDEEILKPGMTIQVEIPQ